jgi:hypothetical protein
MKLPVWMFLTWEWLKRNWKWLLLPLGVLLWFLGRVTAKKEVIITSTALAEADTAQADAKEAAQLSGIAAQHSAAVAVATQKQIDAAADAQGDSEAVNSILAGVGKDMRR